MDSKVYSQSEIIDILNSGDFNKLKGVRESEEFEFKSKNPYLFDTKDKKDKNRNALATAELTKDVASFANINGGIIVCGIKRLAGNKRDIVDDLELMPKNDFYQEQDIIGRINLTIFDTLENVSVKWFPSKDNPLLGLGAIIIPKQNELRKRFIVNICVIEENRLNGVYFGIPCRKDDQTDWLTIKDLKFLRQMMPSSTEEQFMDIFKAIGEIKEMIHTKSKSSNKVVELKKRMEEK